MVEVVWLEDAIDDLIQIYNYISKDSIYYAEETIDDILNQAENLIVFPYIGRKIPETDEENKRELIYKSYRIMYKVESNNIIIRRIWHSARILPKQLIS